MQKWEYKISYFHNVAEGFREAAEREVMRGGSPNDKRINDWLTDPESWMMNNYGSQGWELVSSTYSPKYEDIILILKRPIEE